LSFPAGERNPEKCEAVFRKIARPTQKTEDYIGDIAIAYGVTAKEAKATGKTLLDHTTHLAVHGVLHLLGYDHVTPRKAKMMEPLETRILASLNIADPYEEK
jgi:probable rRNA maturation factor